LRQPDFEATNDGCKVIWIVGRIEYLDNWGTPRHTDVCTRWDKHAEAIVPHKLEMTLPSSSAAP